MARTLLQIVESTPFDAVQISTRTAQIHANILSKSKYLDAPNFTMIHPADLAILYAEYDNQFFDGQVTESVGTLRLDFGLSKRMTSAGGMTTRRTDRTTGKYRYEISISTTILFECFRGDDHRPLTASGIICQDRLEALQRIMEHELIHLIELLLWDHSSCSQKRFHSITRRFFGHSESKHKLITPKEKAMVKFGIRPGVKVRFRFDGVEHTGIVNKVNRRAIVLVENSEGVRYSNGKHYAKFYIPVQMLEPVE